MTKVLHYTNVAGEGAGYIHEQIKQALGDLGDLDYKHKYFPIQNPHEFDREATKEIEKCDLYIGDVGYSYFQLKKAKKLGAKTLLTRFSTHYLYQQQVLQDVYALYGMKVFQNGMYNALKEYKLSDYFLVLSNFCKYTYVLCGVPSDKVFVIHPGVDTKQFSFAEQNLDYFKVLFVGTNPIRKGLPYLLKAWNQLKIKGKLVNRSGIISSMDNVISMPQWTIHDDMVDLYHSCSLTILPSLEEGFAGTNLESMSSGRPVITTNVTGLEDVMTDYKGGILIPPGDTKAIKDAILYYYENCEELIRQGKEARKLAEKHTWGLFRENVAITIKKLL